MTLQSIGPLRARIARKPGKSSAGRPAPTVVLMHGFGAAGDDLVPLAEAIDAPPGTAFVFPEALHSIADFGSMPFFGDGRAWWPIDFARLERAIRSGELRDLSQDVPDGLAEARDAAIAMLEALPDAGFEGPPVLGGFSQGAMLATDVALRTEIGIAALVLMSSTMLAEAEWVPRMPARAGLPVFQSHGTSDPLLPFVLAERLRDALAAAGLKVTFDRFAGQHAIPPTTMTRLGEWLCETLTA